MEAAQNYENSPQSLQMSLKRSKERAKSKGKKKDWRGQGSKIHPTSRPRAPRVLHLPQVPKQRARKMIPELRLESGNPKIEAKEWQNSTKRQRTLRRSQSLFKRHWRLLKSTSLKVGSQEERYALAEQTCGAQAVEKTGTTIVSLTRNHKGEYTM